VLVRSGKPAETYDLGLGAFLACWLADNLPSTARSPVMPSVRWDDDEDTRKPPRTCFRPWQGARARIDASLSDAKGTFKKRHTLVRTAFERVAGPARPVGASVHLGDRHAESFITDADWMVTHAQDQGGGPTLLLSVPGDHDAIARRVIEEAARVLESEVVSVTPA
jgi:hypothetical protein